MRTIGLREVERYINKSTDRELFKIMLLVIAELLVRHDDEEMPERSAG